MLIDGRFRVACALKVLRMLQQTTGWTIAFDDYVNRPQYHAVAEFAELDRYVGRRMAAFSAPKRFSAAALDAAIRRCETVPE